MLEDRAVLRSRRGTVNQELPSFSEMIADPSRRMAHLLAAHSPSKASRGAFYMDVSPFSNKIEHAKLISLSAYDRRWVRASSLSSSRSCCLRVAFVFLQ